MGVVCSLTGVACCVSENPAFLTSEPQEDSRLAFGDGLFYLSNETPPIALLLFNRFHDSVDMVFILVWFSSIHSITLWDFRIGRNLGNPATVSLKATELVEKGQRLAQVGL